MAQKTLTITLIILFFGLNAYSQVPGYMGSRFSIEGDLNVLPWFTNTIRHYEEDVDLVLKKDYDENPYHTYVDADYIINNTGYEIRTNISPSLSYKPITNNFKKTLNLNYSINKTTDFGIKLNYSKSEFKITNLLEGGGYNIITNNTLIPYQLLEYGFNFKFYSSNYVAPVGNYIEFGFGLANVKGEANIKYVHKFSDNSYGNNATKGVKKYTFSELFLKMNAGFYKKVFIGQKLYLNYGVEFNFYFLNKDDPRIDDVLDFNTYPDFVNFNQLVKNSTRRNIGRHIAIDNRYNFKIGLGIIL